LPCSPPPPLLPLLALSSSSLPRPPRCTLFPYTTLFRSCESGGQLRRGLCIMHYRRWQKHGDPLGGGERYATPEEAFLARTEPIVGDPGCLIWTGVLDGSGYGRLRVNGRPVRAHRYAWEREHGPIPDGMFIDHTCWQRSC